MFFAYHYYHLGHLREMYAFELSRCLRFQKNVAGINFREWHVNYDFAGINFATSEIIVRRNPPPTEDELN